MRLGHQRRLQPPVRRQRQGRQPLQDGGRHLGRGHRPSGQTGGPDSPKLEVRFAPWWLSFLPMVWGDYWVVDLDENYRLAAVSEPSRKYLWVLSRTPTVDAAAYRDLLKRLESKGFDLTKLEPPVGLR